jgi:hypothetical protein
MKKQKLDVEDTTTVNNENESSVAVATNDKVNGEVSESASE